MAEIQSETAPFDEDNAGGEPHAIQGYVGAAAGRIFSLSMHLISGSPDLASEGEVLSA